MDKYIKQLLSEKPILRVTPAEMLRKGQLKTVFAGENSALLYAEQIGIYVLMANDHKSAEEAASRMKSPKIIISDITSYDKEIIKRFSLKGSSPCYCAAYMSKEKIAVPQDVVLKPLSLEHLDRVDSCYPLYDREHIKRCIEEKVLLGGFYLGEWVGFIGRHEEGSMGMLHVFEEHRKHGFGYALEGLLINRLLDIGDIPIGHIFTDNYASLALQRKLGMSISKETISWIF